MMTLPYCRPSCLRIPAVTQALLLLLAVNNALASDDPRAIKRADAERRARAAWSDSQASSRNVSAPRAAAPSVYEQSKLVGAGRAQYDNDGESIAISANRILVGGDGDAYVFARNGSAWSLEATLVSGDSSYTAFGSSVALDGDTAVVGAWLANGAANSSGAAYVFVRNGATWTQQAKINASDGQSGDAFGYTVALSGNTIVAGAPDDDSQRGSAYVFVRSGSVWTQQAKLVGADAVAGDQLSAPLGLAVDQNTAVVGSYQKGCAYVFFRNGTQWSQQAKLLPSGTVTGFGWSLDVKGDRIVANTGEVYARSGGAWTQQAAFSTPKSSVALSGSRIIAGDRFADGMSLGTGVAYVYKQNSGVWSEEAKLMASDGSFLHTFGDSVDIDGDFAVVGAPGEPQGGVSYAFQLAQTSSYGGPLRFVPVTPCRVVDTRAGEGKTGSFGPPALEGGQTREIPVPQSSCVIPATARAYSLNITVVPAGTLSYLSVWPAGQSQPLVSTLNSFEGRVVANAAIVPAGPMGAINVFVTNRTDVIVDINGYFAP